MEDTVLEEDRTEERRVSQRIRFSEPVQFQMQNPHQFGGTLACDISESGIRVNFNDFIPLNTNITFQVKLFTGKVIDCVGRVVWIQKFPFSDRYQTGVQFVDEEFQLASKEEIQQIIEASRS